jgi:hypothetical protein
MSIDSADLEREANNRTFQLVFEGATCDDCRVTVPVTRSCPCGAWTPRDDEHVARRRAAVSDLRALLKTPATGEHPIAFGEAIDALSPWIADLFGGLNLLGGPGADASGVRAQVDALRLLSARVAANGRRRPGLALWDPLARLITSLGDLAATYIDAACAPDPGSAEALQAVGQRHLDEATKQIGLVNVRLDWWGLPSTIRLPDSAMAAATVAYDVTGAQDLVDLDRRGMPLYERITGKPVGPSGIGLGLLIDLGLVDRAFDEDRVYRVANLAYERLDKFRARFIELIDDPAWWADLLHARRVFYEAQLTAETLLRELAGDRRLEAGAVLRLGAQMTERVSGTLLGLMVGVAPSSLKRTAPYDKIQTAAVAAGFGDALTGFDDRIRNADAHSDFDVGPDYVVLGRNRAKPEKVSDDELVDIVLASLESCAALLAAIDCVINEEGHKAGTDRLADLSTTELLAILLAASGVHPGRIELEADRLEISGSVHGNLGVNPITVIAFLAPSIPVDVRRFVFRLMRRDGTVVLKVALSPLRRFQAGEGLAKNAAFIEFLGRATLNGRVVFSRRHVRFMLAFYVHELLEATIAEVEAGGPLLAATARRLKDRELADALDAFLLMKRAREGGPPASKATVLTFKRLATYLAAPPGPWNDGSGPRFAAG